MTGLGNGVLVGRGMADFIPGVTPITASGAILTAADKQAMHDQIEKGWITAGPVNRKFEARLSEYTGIKHVRSCNSGSSANLLAVAAMVESGKWRRGDEIITAACGFPTTVNPLLLYGLIPVFVDIDIPTYNALPETIADAISKKTKGIMLAHTLGNPFSHRVSNTVHPVIQDCCDALGARYGENHVGQKAILSTCSFFPAHHITTGEGGAVFTNDDELVRVVESIRDWGRDCWCEPGANNTCGKRFECKVDGVEYDHKYAITHLGYNLKSTDIAAACGLSQMERINWIVKTRRENFNALWERLASLHDYIILPEGTPDTSPSWFGFPITIRKEGERQALQEFLWEKKIDSRLIFAGNLHRQSYMMKYEQKVSGYLCNSNKIMADSLWLGIHPALDERHITYMADMIKAFFQ